LLLLPADMALFSSLPGAGAGRSAPLRGVRDHARRAPGCGSWRQVDARRRLEVPELRWDASKTGGTCALVLAGGDRPAGDHQPEVARGGDM